MYAHNSSLLIAAEIIMMMVVVIRQDGDYNYIFGKLQLLAFLKL